MKKIVSLGLIVCGLLLASAGWRTDFEQAKLDAKKNNKLILLRFSGSDWCVDCIRMEREVFSDQGFGEFAAAHLELVGVDFPHKKKNKPVASVSRQNEALAEKYNKDGHIPYTLLLDADGKVLKVWDGYNGEKPGAFITQIRSYAGAN